MQRSCYMLQIHDELPVLAVTLLLIRRPKNR